MLYAVIDKNTNRAVSIVDDILKSYFEQKLPAFDVVEIESVGSGTSHAKGGIISFVTIRPTSLSRTKFENYIMIKSHPEEITLNEAYDILVLSMHIYES